MSSSQAVRELCEGLESAVTKTLTALSEEVQLQDHMISLLQQKLDFLKSKGLTVGVARDAGKEPYLAYVIEDGSELSDQQLCDHNVDMQVELDELYKAIDPVLDRTCTSDHRDNLWKLREVRNKYRPPEKSESA